MLTCVTVQTAFGFATISQAWCGTALRIEGSRVSVWLSRHSRKPVPRAIAYLDGSQSVGKPAAKEGHDHDEARKP